MPHLYGTPVATGRLGDWTLSRGMLPALSQETPGNDTPTISHNEITTTSAWPSWLRTWDGPVLWPGVGTQGAPSCSKSWTTLWQSLRTLFPSQSRPGHALGPGTVSPTSDRGQNSIGTPSSQEPQGIGIASPSLPSWQTHSRGLRGPSPRLYLFPSYPWPCTY